MSFIQCSVGGCDKKLQPILKLDPRDRDTWMYRECDLCLRPVCEKHSNEIDGQILCDRCQKEAERPPLIQLEVRQPASSPCQAPPAYWGEDESTR